MDRDEFNQLLNEADDLASSDDPASAIERLREIEDRVIGELGPEISLGTRAKARDHIREIIDQLQAGSSFLSRIGRFFGGKAAPGAHALYR